MSETEILAHVIMGEASLCGFGAMLAVAWVYQRNPTMYGWQPPSALALWTALMWRWFPDPTDGARYLVSNSDLQRPAVRSFTTDRGSPTFVAECAGGRQLLAFR
jgi:hypothetical protein